MCTFYSQTDWADYLPEAESAGQIVPSETTGFSLFQALYSFNPRSHR